MDMNQRKLSCKAYMNFDSDAIAGKLCLQYNWKPNQKLFLNS